MKIINSIKEYFGENQELIESTEIATKERLTSPFYGYFIISWFVTNWKIFYVALFIDQELIYKKYNLLRHDYISDYVFPTGTTILKDYFLIPLLFTVLFFYVFPYISRSFFRKYLRNKKAMQVIELQENKKVIVQETKLLKEEGAKAKLEKKIEKETPEILWEKDFIKLKNEGRLYNKFRQIIDCVYEHKGHLEYGLTKLVDQDILVFSDTNELIIINGNSIKLTEKGKFFTKRYTNN